MSGLLALLDDVAGIAKVAAASVDDVTGMAMKSSAKAAGALIDDAAVTPKYVHGFDAKRELPIIWKIAKGSIFNKLVILLPIALLLSVFAPWSIAPLLMLGGGYLCYEGAEKVWHVLSPPGDPEDHYEGGKADPAVGLEEQKVAGAIKTDFILSAEIMTIVLSEATGLIDAMQLARPAELAFEAAVLAVAGLMITAVVYGAVALIVKMDDIGLSMVRRDQLAALGRLIVKGMPAVMKLLTIVGTAAMIWVGGNIVIHGLHELGLRQPDEWIIRQAEWAAAAVPFAHGAVRWIVVAFFDGIFGLILGLILIPTSHHLLGPLARATVLPLWSGAKALFSGNRA